MRADTDRPPTDSKTDAPRLVLDESALDAVRRSPEPARLATQDGAWRDDLVVLLNGALATEIVCALRYRRHHHTAVGLASAKIAEEFLIHANEETAHGDRLARRIVQLGGEPDFSPATLLARTHAAYDSSLDLKVMIRANLLAELVAIEAYTQMIRLIGPRDPTTRRLLEDILSQEQEHAEELKDWLAD